MSDLDPTAAEPAAPADPTPNAGKAGLKLVLELGPLVLFFWLTKSQGILVAIQAFLVATAVAFPLAWRLERKLPLMSLVTAIFVGAFGGLALWFGDSTFFKLKPTVASAFMALVIAGGLLRGKFVLKALLGATLRMDDEGWRILSWRWVGLFAAIAVGNEIVWRTQTDEFWAGYKLSLFGVTLVFMMFQVGLMKRHELPASSEPE